MIAREYIRKWIQRDQVKYGALRADMISARIGMTLEQYVIRSIQIAIVPGILLALLGFFLSTYATLSFPVLRTGVYNVFNIQFPVIVIGLLPALAIEIPVIIISFLLGTYIVYSLLLRMPSIEKNTRSIRINLTLHNAVAYIYAMRRGGAQLMTIFRSLSDRADIYGETALEFRQIVRDADFFGYDVISAISHLAETTPSEKFKNFLEDLLSVIESGGDMSEFLALRVRIYQEEARFEQKHFLTILSMVAEAYVTLFVAGPLFLIIIMVVMGLLGGGAVLQLSLMTYLVIPIGSLIFILLIDFISFKSEKATRYTKTKWLHAFSDVTIIRRSQEESLFEQLKQYDQLRNFVSFLRHPFEGFIRNANTTLYVTIPVAILYVFFVLSKVPHYINIETYITVIDAHIVFAVLIVLIPYAICYEIYSRKALAIQSLVPDFLERMAGINQVGLTIVQAISIMVNTNLGLLSYEIRKIKRDLDWGGNFNDALIRFEQRISTPSIARTVTLITKASEMSGQIGEVLAIASSDAKMSETLKKERAAEMFIYIAIVYLSFFVFMFVVAILATQFLPILAHITSKGLTGAGAFGGIGAIPAMSFDRLLFHACLIQAFFSGLIAGQMSESSVASGVKHACVLLVIALVVFKFILII